MHVDLQRNRNPIKLLSLSLCDCTDHPTTYNGQARHFTKASALQIKEWRGVTTHMVMDWYILKALKSEGTNGFKQLQKILVSLKSWVIFFSFTPDDGKPETRKQRATWRRRSGVNNKWVT